MSVATGGLMSLSPCAFPLLPPVLGGAVQGPRLTPVAMRLRTILLFADIGAVLGALEPALGIDVDTNPLAGAAMLITLALVILVALSVGSSI